MKTKFIIATLFISLLSSCQNKTTTIMQNPEITAKNIVNKLVSEVKHYNYEPMYYLTFRQNSCFSEIFINDIPVYKNFNQESSGRTLEINNYILKSGVQKVTFRLYPAGKIGSADFSTLVSDTEMNIEIEESDNDKKEQEGKKIMSYSTPLTTTINEYGNPISKFEGTNKTYYEASFTFNATVPYEIKDFENSEDLRKFDKDILEKKLLAEYNKTKEIYQNKDYDGIAKISYDNLKNQFVTKYETREYITDAWEMLMDAYKLSTFEMQPVENYKMVFFADGKLVALMQNSKDSRVRGNSILWAKFERGEGVETLFCNRYFYIPKGKTEFEIY